MYYVAVKNKIPINNNPLILLPVGFGLFLILNSVNGLLNIKEAFQNQDNVFSLVYSNIPRDGAKCNLKNDVGNDINGCFYHGKCNWKYKPEWEKCPDTFTEYEQQTSELSENYSPPSGTPCSIKKSEGNMTKGCFYKFPDNTEGCLFLKSDTHTIPEDIICPQLSEGFKSLQEEISKGKYKGQKPLIPKIEKLSGKCTSKNPDGTEYKGCSFYPFESLCKPLISNTHTIPDDYICPQDSEGFKYLLDIISKGEYEGQELLPPSAETEAPPPAETEAPPPAETEAPPPAETEAPLPYQLGDEIIQNLLYIIPQLNDIQIDMISNGKIKELMIEGNKYDFTNLEKFFDILNKNLIVDRIKNYLIADPNKLRNLCVIIKGAFEISNSNYAKTILGDVLKLVRPESNSLSMCHADCSEMKNDISSFESQFISNAADTSFITSKNKYLDMYKENYEKTCQNQEQEEQKPEIQKPEETNNKNTPKEFTLPGSMKDKSGYLIIPPKGKGQPIFDFYDSTHSNLDNMTFSKRSEFINAAKRYVCNRSQNEIQAFEVLGEGVDKLDWYNDISKTVEPTPDNKISNTRFPSKRINSNRVEAFNNYRGENTLNSSNSNRQDYNLKNINPTLNTLKNKLNKLNKDRNELSRLYHKAEEIVYSG